MFSLIKDLIVPQVEPGAGFILSFKPGGASQRQQLTACGWRPDALLGHLSVHWVPWGGRRTIPSQRTESGVPVSLHSRQVLKRQRPVVKKGRWTCPNSSQLLRRQSFGCVRGGTDSNKGRWGEKAISTPSRPSGLVGPGPVRLGCPRTSTHPSFKHTGPKGKSHLFISNTAWSSKPRGYAIIKLHQSSL